MKNNGILLLSYPLGMRKMLYKVTLLHYLILFMYVFWHPIMAVLKKYCTSTLKQYFYEEYYLVRKTIRTDIYKVSVF